MNNENENYGGSRPEEADNRNYGGETSANNSYSGAPNMSSEESLRDTGSDQSDWENPETDYAQEQAGAATGNERNDADSEDTDFDDDDFDDDEIDSGREDDDSTKNPGQLGNL